MAIHNLYIFDRNGSLLFYHEWNRLKQSGMSREEEAKLMYGMLFSIKSFVSKISPLDLKKGFLSYKTNKYALHYLETPTGLKFVLNTDIHASEVRELMKKIYSQVYVEYIVKNPVCRLDEPIKSELFKEKLDELIKQSSYYTAKIA
uniref:Trafficking protein particle complex subunit n=1 Tax=Lygus hesperus TaxID=30085 RepID=A0A146LAV0_LYGHE